MVRIVRFAVVLFGLCLAPVSRAALVDVVLTHVVGTHDWRLSLNVNGSVQVSALAFQVPTSLSDFTAQNPAIDPTYLPALFPDPPYNDFLIVDVQLGEGAFGAPPLANGPAQNVLQGTFHSTNALVPFVIPGDNFFGGTAFDPNFNPLDVSIRVVPEPSALPLAAVSALGLALARRRARVTRP
jgi:hypothetical protein